MAQNVNEDHIRKIVEEVVQRVVTSSAQAGSSSAGGEGGVFQTIDAAVQAATRAQQQLVEMSLEQRKQIVEAFRCTCLLYTSPSPRDRTRSRMPSSA